MSSEHFQLIDNERIHNSIVKRDFYKLCHQQGALLNDLDRNVQFIFGEYNKYHQVENSHLGFDITKREADGIKFNFTNDPATKEVTRLVNNVLVFCFKEAALSTTGGMEVDVVKSLGPVSTIMRVLTSKDGDLFSHFDKMDETENGSNNASLKQMLINNPTEANT